MNIKKILLAVILTNSIALPALADSVTVVGKGSTIIINKLGGFDGQEGRQREEAFTAAAKVWADTLVSPVEIVIDAEFSSTLYCDNYSGTLGAAGPYNYYFPSGRESYGLKHDVWYPLPLINSHTGYDVFPNDADISAEFNGRLGSNGCMSNSGWYYGTDGNAPHNLVDLYEVVLHELGHGMGFLSLVNSNGSFDSNMPDIFSTFLRDESYGTLWPSLSTAQRGDSMQNDGNLVWSGPEVSALANKLTNGVNNGHVQMYAPNPYQGGSSVSHFDTALTPNEVMEPQYTGDSTYQHTVALFKDIGWQIVDDKEPPPPAENNIPQITGQTPLVTNEDSTLTLSLNNLSVTDSDNSFPADFTLSVYEGQNYSVNGLSITPVRNFYGDLTVPVSVSDGKDSSPVFNLNVAVAAVNDAPVISGQRTLRTSEDSSITLSINDLTINDPDSNQFTLNVRQGNNYSVSGTTVTPDRNFSGTLTVPVSVSDGQARSNIFNLTIAVQSTNDAPVITGQKDLSVDEDNSITLSVANLTIVDTDDTQFSLQIGSGSNYSVIDKTVYPSGNFSGTLTVPVTVNDGTTSSNTYSLSITVNPVNDAPVLSGNPVKNIAYTDSYSTRFSATDVDSSTLSYSVSSAHKWLSISNNGVLSGTPAANNIGTQLVTVTVTDGLLSDSIRFQLTVADSAESDLKATIDTDRGLISSNETTPLIFTVSNNGPAARVSGYADIELSATAKAMTSDARCTELNQTQWQCLFTDIDQSTSFEFYLSGQDNSVISLAATVSSAIQDSVAENNWADVAIVVDDNPQQPTDKVDFATGHNGRDAAFIESQQSLIMATDLNSNEQQIRFSDDFLNVQNMSRFGSNFDANAVVIDDFNADGRDDVVFATSTGGQLYLQTASGGWQTAISISSTASQDVISADFNGDSVPDLVFVGDSNALYLNNAEGNFTLADDFGNTAFNAVESIDYNRNGRMDIVVTDPDGIDKVYINDRIRQPNNIFNNAINISEGKTHSRDVVVADFDGDGIQNEFAIARETTPNSDSVVIYQVVNAQVSQWLTLPMGDLISISSGDINDNQQIEIAAINDNGVVMFWEFSDEKVQLLQSFEYPGAQNILLADLNNDQADDIILLSDGSAASALYVSNNQDSADNGNNGNGDSTNPPPVDEPEPADPVVDPGNDANDDGNTDSGTNDDQTPPPFGGTQIGALGSVLWLLNILLIRRRPSRRSDASSRIP